MKKMKLLSKTIKEGKGSSRLHIGESRDGKTDTFFTALITYGYGADHGHVELSMDECKDLRDFLNELIEKSDKKGGVDPL